MSLLGQTQTKGFGDEREFRGLRLLLARLRLRRCATFRTGPVEQVDWAHPPYGLWRCEASSSALLSVRGTKMAMSAASILQQSSNPHGEERVFASPGEPCGRYLARGHPSRRPLRGLLRMRSVHVVATRLD